MNILTFDPFEDKRAFDLLSDGGYDLLLPKINGNNTYKSRLKNAAEEILSRPELIGLDQSGRKRAHLITAIMFLLHSLAHMASLPYRKDGTKKQGISVGLRNEDFGSDKPDGFPKRDEFREAFWALESLQDDHVPWVSISKGFRHPTEDLGRRSTLKPHLPFLDFLIAHKLVFPTHPKSRRLEKPDQHFALLRRSGDDEGTDAVRIERPLSDSESILPQLNDCLGKLKIGVVWPSYALYLKYYDHERRRSKAFPFDRYAFYRTFCGAEEYGGRLAGHWLMQTPKKIRPYVTFNGSPTTEVDYEAMQLGLLYRRIGEPVPDDPYSLKIDHEGTKLGKGIFKIAIGAENFGSVPVLAFHDLGQAYSYDVVAKGFEQFWVKHAPVKHLVEAGSAWRFLQKDESEIILEVIRKLLELGIAAVPIHDSVIVQARHRATTIEVMQDIAGIKAR